MEDQPVVLAVASYASRAGADKDFGSLWSLESLPRSDHLSAAVMEKGSSGELEMSRHASNAAGLAWGTALLGGALTTVAAPVGLAYLAAGLSSSAEWAGATAILARFWNDIPRDKVHRMSSLLEAGQASLVVVAIGHDSGDVLACLSGATSTIMSESLPVDLEADFTRAADRA